MFLCTYISRNKIKICDDGLHTCAALPKRPQTFPLVYAAFWGVHRPCLCARVCPLPGSQAGYFATRPLPLSGGIPVRMRGAPCRPPRAPPPHSGFFPFLLARPLVALLLRYAPGFPPLAVCGGRAVGGWAGRPSAVCRSVAMPFFRHARGGTMGASGCRTPVGRSSPRCAHVPACFRAWWGHRHVPPAVCCLALPVLRHLPARHSWPWGAPRAHVETPRPPVSTPSPPLTEFYDDRCLVLVCLMMLVWFNEIL